MLNVGYVTEDLREPSILAAAYLFRVKTIASCVLFSSH